ncbi:MAG: NAD-dependent epimerase/dehydratase family protein [Deltaproteobacteria bacterium]|jgi:nucleoside-diphosphate-sugar epimerase|nr:NAD-dependent epimerase/dehydratase family protein [Deltaproteobacteria bacterium]
MRVFITGATGFIGYHLAARLLAEGHTLRALVRSPEKGALVLGPLGLGPDDFVLGDMAEAPVVAKALEGCDAAVHSAAAVSVTDRATRFDANLEGTRAVVGQACERGLQTLFLSSMTAIFDPKRVMNDDSPLVRSRTEYGRSKAECDRWVRELQEQGAPVGIVYPGGVVGPDDPGMSESVKAYRAFLRGTLQSEGGNWVLDVRDLALLMMRMLEHRVQGRVVAGGHFLDWDELTALLEEITGATISRIRAPGWLLRLASRGMDVVGALTGRKMPMTGEGIEIATRARPIEDSPRIAELGIVWRDPRETLHDLFQWYLDAGRLPPEAVPALTRSATQATDPSASEGAPA